MAEAEAEQRVGAWGRSLLPPVLALALGGLVWEGSVRAFDLPLYLLPPPSAVGRAALEQSATLLAAALVTARAALLGFGLAAVLGTLLGLLLGLARWIERAFYPYAIFLQTVPIVAIAPLLVLWLGPGARAVTASALIVSIFPVIAGALAGVRGVDPELRALFRLYGSSRWSLLWKLELPASLPSLVTGLRVASGLAVVGTLVGEFVAGFAEDAAGLGILVLSAYRQLQTDLLFAALLLAALLGFLMFAGVGLLGHLLLRRWHPSERA